MMDDDEWAAMRAELAEARADNLVSIRVLNRTTTPATQAVRIVGRGGQANAQDSGQGAEVRGKVTVKGDVGLDLQVGDEFSHGGALYRVGFVDPNRRARTSAEAEAVQ